MPDRSLIEPVRCGSTATTPSTALTWTRRSSSDRRWWAVGGFAGAAKALKQMLVLMTSVPTVLFTAHDLADVEVCRWRWAMYSWTP